MPSAQDVYITPASSVIDVYTGSTKVGYVSGTSTTKMVVSGATHLKLAASDDLELFSGTNKMDFNVAGTTVLELTGSTFRGGGFTGFGVGTWNPVGRFNVSGGATTLDNGGSEALYLKNAGSTYLSFDSYGGPGVSISAPADMHITGTSGITFKTPANGIVLSPTGTSAGDTLPLRFRELAANGSATIRMRSPDSINSENTWVLPPDIGTANQVLTVASVASGEMTLDWADASGGGGTFGGTLSDNYIPIGTAADTIGNFVLGLTENNSIWIGSDPSSTTSTAEHNVALGITTLDSITTGDKNVAIGYSALTAATTAHSSVAIGYQALDSVTAGSENVAIGTYAGQAYVGGAGTTGGFGVFIGHTAGYLVTGNGSYKSITLVGHAAGYQATGAQSSTGIGASALYYADGALNTTAVGRVAGAYAKGTGSTHVGDSSGYRISGNYNTSVGFAALSGGSSGTGYGTAEQNIAIGREAMLDATSAKENVVIGNYAAAEITGGDYNTAIGYGALRYGTTTNRQVAIGYAALSKFTQDGDLRNTAVGMYAMLNPRSGSNNVALGYGAMQGDNSTYDSDYNTALGSDSLFALQGGNNNVAVGYAAGYAVTTGYDNTIVGTSAGATLTTGYFNTYIGKTAGSGATTAAHSNVGIGLGALSSAHGAGNVAIGRGALSSTTDANQVAIGYSALESNTSGEKNTAIGYQALATNTTGNYNTAIGHEAMELNVGGYYNVAIGYEALATLAPNSTEGYNTALGYSAGTLLTTGTFNTLLGASAGDSLTTAQRNTMVGHRAGQALTTQSFNTMVGERSGENSSDGIYNTFVGYLAGYNNAHATGRNTFIGSNAGQSANNQYQSVFIGQEAGYGAASSGYSNVVVGRQAGYSMTSALANVWIGHAAGFAATTADKSVFIGESAGKAITTQDASVLIGFEAGRLQEVGSGGNVAIGHQALYSGTQNYQNVAIGISAGRKATGASANNVYLGSAAGPSSAGAESNKLYIHNAEGTPLIYGDFSADTVDINGDLSTLDSHKLKVVNASNNYWAIYNQSNGKMRIDQGTTQRVLASSGEFQFANDIIVDGNHIVTGNIVATGATAHVIVGQYTRLQRNTNTNGLHLTDSGGNAVSFSTLSGSLGGLRFDNTTANTIYRGAGKLIYDATELHYFSDNVEVNGNIVGTNIASNALITAGTGLNVAGGTLTTPSLTMGVAVTEIKDEDNMASDSATMLATQQSIKAYVDAAVAGGGGGSGLITSSTRASTGAVALYGANNATLTSDADFAFSSNKLQLSDDIPICWHDTTNLFISGNFNSGNPELHLAAGTSGSFVVRANTFDFGYQGASTADTIMNFYYGGGGTPDNDGQFKWDGSADAFVYMDDITMNSTERINFGDTGTYIHQSADGVLDLVSDTEIEINATTIDMNGNLDLSGDFTGNLGASTFNGTLTATSSTALAFRNSNSNIQSNASSNLQINDDTEVRIAAPVLEVNSGTASTNTQLVLKSTDAGSTSGPRLNIDRDSASPANNDTLGIIQFRGDVNGAGLQNLNYIASKVLDVAQGSENSVFHLSSVVNNSSKVLQWGSHGSTADYGLYPTNDGTADLGVGSNQWRKLFATEYYSNGVAGADPVATNGSNIISWQIGTTLYFFEGIKGITTTFTENNVSDKKLKENISVFDTGLSLINQLTPKKFKFTENFRASKKLPDEEYIGYIAQDIEKISEEYVDKTVDFEGEKYLGIDKKFDKELQGALINAIKELSAKNDALEARIKALEG